MANIPTRSTLKRSASPSSGRKERSCAMSVNRANERWIECIWVQRPVLALDASKVAEQGMGQHR